MAKIYDWPMLFARYTKDDRVATIVYVASSGRIMEVDGVPRSFIHTPFDLASTRLLSAGWELQEEGMVVR